MRFVVFIGLTILVVLLAAPAAVSADSVTVVAFTEADGEGDGDEVPPTTAVSEGGIAPAEMAPPVEESADEDQWTARYLAPAVALLGILGVIGAILLYGMRLGGRYRVVD